MYVLKMYVLCVCVCVYANMYVWCVCVCVCVCVCYRILCADGVTGNYQLCLLLLHWCLQSQLSLFCCVSVCVCCVCVMCVCDVCDVCVCVCVLA